MRFCPIPASQHETLTQQPANFYLTDLLPEAQQHIVDTIIQAITIDAIIDNIIIEAICVGLNQKI
jgi:hypothetical protein